MTRRKAILDPDGIYRGHEPAPPGFKPKAGEPPPLPEHPDLEEGRYRWDGETFLPVKSPEPEDLVNERHTLVAIAQGFIAIRESGIALPEITNRWLDWYEKTVDGAVARPKPKKA